MIRSDHQPTYIYLHGFASGPLSTKAQYFDCHLRQLGLTVLLPDLNGGDFLNLTISGQLKIIEELIADLPPDQPVVIIGSSMGGLLSTLIANSNQQVKGLVLLAPGFGLPLRWTEMLGERGLKDWQVHGSTAVFHHGLNQSTKLGYGFLLDAQTYETEGLKISVPTIVFHGRHDETVPLQESMNFAALNKDLAELHVLDDDHQLITTIDRIWNHTHGFLIKNGLAPRADYDDPLLC